MADDGIICFLFSYYLKLSGIVVIIKGFFRQILIGGTTQPPFGPVSLRSISSMYRLVWISELVMDDDCAWFGFR